MSTETPPKGKTAGKLLWTQRLEAATKGAGVGILTIARGVVSSDAPTRWMSILFFVSLFSVLFSVSWGVSLYRERLSRQKHELTESERSAQNLSDFVAKQAEENKRKASQFGLGSFQIELLPLSGQRKIRGVINMAEVDVTIQCDEKETRDYVDAHSVEARSNVASVINPIQRGELLTPEGKARLKKAIIEKFNAWLPKGKVVDVYFTRLIAT